MPVHPPNDALQFCSVLRSLQRPEKACIVNIVSYKCYLQGACTGAGHIVPSYQIDPAHSCRSRNMQQQVSKSSKSRWKGR